MNRMLTVDAVELRLVYEDDCLLAVDKPSGMLAVPGREFRICTLTRVQQWATVIEKVLEQTLERNSESPTIPLLTFLKGQGYRVPRQEQKFYRYLSRHCKTDEETLREAWKAIYDADRRMFSGLPPNLPKELISAMDIAEAYHQDKIYSVHRIDQETSGLLLFAKDSATANRVCAQFEKHSVRHLLILISSIYPYVLFPLATEALCGECLWKDGEIGRFH